MGDDAVIDLNNGRISGQLLKSKSGEFDIESIHTLTLKGQGISDLGCIGECTAIERLDISKNDVSILYSLAGLANLTNLNLSANRISSLDGLQSLDNLKCLNLAGNLINSVDSLRCLSGLEKLVDLRLKDSVFDLTNPICMSITYKFDVIKVLPNLHNLDGERLVGKGSEVFNMFSEFDKKIKGGTDETSLNNNNLPGPWVTDDFWKSTDQFEKTSLNDADKQLTDLLSECNRLAKEAEEKIKLAINDAGPASEDCAT